VHVAALQDTLGQLDYYQFEMVVTTLAAPLIDRATAAWATSALLTFEQVKQPAHHAREPLPP
jgi:hypothetical protein